MPRLGHRPRSPPRSESVVAQTEPFSLSVGQWVKGELSYLQHFAITLKATTNVCIQVLGELEFSCLSDKCPRVPLLGDMVKACFVLRETAKLFCRVAVHFTFPHSF